MAEKSDFSTVKKILKLQVVVIVIVSLAFSVLGTVDMLISSILGGVTAFLPNLYFAYRMSLVKDRGAKKIVHSFYSGESRKILMTCALFALAFQVPNVQFFPLMVCFVAVLSVFWLALILFAQDFKIKSVRKNG
ncbi:MAG: ATP synthase subunit I [Methylococcales bacterium]|nr:ATP synthase subunit I [Methylococcales bacterium]